MYKALILSVVMALAPNAAVATECGPERLVYVEQDGKDEIRFERYDLIYKSAVDGSTTRYGTMGGGTGIMARGAFDPVTQENFTYFTFNISKFTKPGAPDHLLYFHNAIYVPECR